MTLSPSNSQSDHECGGDGSTHNHTKVHTQTSPGIHDALVDGTSKLSHNDVTFDSSCAEKIDASSFVSSSSSSLLAVRRFSCDSILEKQDDPHSVSFDLESSDNPEFLQDTLLHHHCRTPQRRRKQDAASSSSSNLPPRTATPKLCLGNLPELVDDALTRVADVMFDGMRCGMDDTCNKWTYVPGEP